ncbi:hypothetical protein C7H19_22710 [Aphanothece hegewaldii CCALA 016]|uniref:protein O-GlcNAc transferase n=1 Tax=Aphanothece hegewaldii CCALA 016 TaxID=2107694 RepID=A0A2T1LRL9_9CHRO|nr:tetratricopeptide repeat protein [Aphanothece hegewaldii]PSF31392.1 hypothetical protein C7H19_22710 [Aphanothece hegewaldii CCALA 016]
MHEKNTYFQLSSLIESATAHHENGILLEAEAIYKKVLAAFTTSEIEIINSSNHHENWVAILINLGTVLRQQGKHQEAISTYHQALEMQPDSAQAYDGLGSCWAEQGKFEAAIQSYRQAINYNPNLAQTYNNLGTILVKSQGKLEEAIDSYQQALKIQPNFAQAYYNLGNAFKDQGQPEKAIASYKQALTLDPQLTVAKWAICMGQLSILYESSAEIETSRKNYQSYLQTLVQSFEQASPQELSQAAIDVGSLQPFYLAYQGHNDRELQKLYGTMIAYLMASRYPQWSQPREITPLVSNEKIRLGIVCGYFHHHSVWKIPVKGWVQNLDKTQFELFGYYTNAIQDRETAIASRAFDHFRQGLLPIEQWCQTIADDRLHVLIYPELGMDPNSIQLAALRLAPIQLTSWGHPNTSGLPTIDYYLSSDLMEPEQAQAHYTEKLVKLPNLSIYYPPPSSPIQKMQRENLEVSEKDILFWCCQSLYKYLPQDDDVFPRIAQQLPQCKFIFLEAPQGKAITEIFQRRLNRTFSEFGLSYHAYCRFLPRLSAGAFKGVAAIADIILDSVGWSGCNSTLESLSHVLPVVTLPGELMRGRHTMAILKMMGIEELIATSKDDYINLAVRLGQDPLYRQQIREKIDDNKYKLYGDLQPIFALEKFLINTIQTKTLQFAIQQHQANHLAKAEQIYQKILDRQPECLDALYGLGVLASQMSQVQKAEGLFQKILMLQPKMTKAWLSLGNLYQAQKQWSQAVEAYQKALSLEPNMASIYNNLGYTWQLQQKIDEAIACYEKALALQPNCYEATLNLAVALNTQGKLTREQQDHYAALATELGTTQQQQGNLTLAVEYYRQALTLKSCFK